MLARLTNMMHRTARSLRPSAGDRGGLILLYHRVANPIRDPQLLAVTPEHFEGHLDVLRHGARPMPLIEMVARVSEGKSLPPRAVAITFDDGYSDNARYAEPRLARASVTATLFVATDYVLSGQPYWWDAIDTAVLGSLLPPTLELPFPGAFRRWATPGEPIGMSTWNVLDAPESGTRHAAYAEITAAVKPLDLKARDALLTALRHATGGNLAGEEDARPMKPEEVAAISARGVIAIGAHTAHHLQLSQLDSSTQAEEIGASARAVAEWTGRPPELFAYPYGTTADYDAATVEAVKVSGFRAACSNFPGRVDRDTKPFELPRMLVRNVSPEMLERQLDAAFAQA